MVRKQGPFELTTDLRFLYESDEHKRVFDETLKAIQKGEGLVCITGGAGTGKSLFCQRLLAEVNGALRPILLSTPPTTPKDINRALNSRGKKSEGKIPLLIIDEAQQLDRPCLDHIKMLWNLGSEGGTLFQTVLVGQPELAEKLSHEQFRPLAQRVGANLSLKTLKRGETLAYLVSRLSVVKLAGKVRFTQGAVNFLFVKTRGIPRLINRIAGLAVEESLSRGEGNIGILTLFRVARGFSPLQEGGLASDSSRRKKTLLWFLTLVLFGVLAGGFFYPGGFWPTERVYSVTDTDRIASESEYTVKVGTYVTPDGADRAIRSLGSSGFEAAFKEQKLSDGWVVYDVYIKDALPKKKAEDTAATLRREHGFPSSVVVLR